MILIINNNNNTDNKIIITIVEIINLKRKKSVIRSGEWNNMISLFIILSLYS